MRGIVQSQHVRTMGAVSSTSRVDMIRDMITSHIRGEIAEMLPAFSQQDKYSLLVGYETEYDTTSLGDRGDKILYTLTLVDNATGERVWERSAYNYTELVLRAVLAEIALII